MRWEALLVLLVVAPFPLAAAVSTPPPPNVPACVHVGQGAGEVTVSQDCFPKLLCTPMCPPPLVLEILTKLQQEGVGAKLDSLVAFCVKAGTSTLNVDSTHACDEMANYCSGLSEDCALPDDLCELSPVGCPWE